MTHWSPPRVARLGFLIGLGWTGERVAADPVIATTPNNVYREAMRFGLKFRDVGAMSDWSADMTKRFYAAAAKRGISQEELARRLVLIIACDPCLIDNILDDADSLASSRCPPSASTLPAPQPSYDGAGLSPIPPE